MEDIERLTILVGVCRQVVGHFESEGHSPVIEGECCLCWAVGMIRDMLGSYELEQTQG